MTRGGIVLLTEKSRIRNEACCRQKPRDEIPDLGGESLRREPPGRREQTLADLVLDPSVVEDANDLEGSILLVPVNKVGMIDDFDLSASLWDPRDHPGSDHLGDGDSERLVPASGRRLRYGRAAMPCSTAQTAAWTRLVRSSLRRMCWT